MATIQYDDGAVKTIGTAGLSTNPGGGGHGRNGAPVMAGAAGRVLKQVTGTITFDNSYPTGGEDISDIFDLFRDTAQAAANRTTKIYVEQPLTGAQTGKFAKVDYTNKKIQLFTNASPAVEVANASDQSAIVALPFIAVGPA